MQKPNLPLVALLSVTLLAMEMIWTRIFSAEYFYTFAFLILSLAVLGLGLGALALRLVPALGRPAMLPVMLCLTGIAALAGPPSVLHLQLVFAEILSSWTMFGKLLLTLLILSAAYFFGGISLATVFKRHYSSMPRLYMADLLGAALGVVLSIWMMNTCGTRAATFLASLPVFAAAILATRSWKRVIPIGLCCAATWMTWHSQSLLLSNAPDRAKVIYEHWDAMARVKLYGFSPEYRGIELDNAANSPVLAFDGDWEALKETKIPFTVDVSNLIARFDGCRFLSLGAGGGSDVLQALQAGATDVHAVEVNPHINRMMLEGDPGGYIESANTNGEAAAEPVTLVDFSGRLYHDPRVTVATEDARAYVRRFHNRFDLIFSLSSNSFAALASGSFALAENYLFTAEAFADYWHALSDNGFLVMEHQFYMPRLVTGLMVTLNQLGIENPQEHFAVYNLPQHRRKILLLSKQPLTDDLRQNGLGKLSESNAGLIHLLYPAEESRRDNAYQKIVDEGWAAVADSVPINISPTTDNRPFIAQLGMWKNFEFSRPERLFFMSINGYPLAQVIMATILAVVVVLIIPLNLIPRITRHRGLRMRPWLYFFAIGIGFMSIEVVLMQKYALFVGPSVYSIATILLAMLLGAGLGSRCAPRFGDSLPFIAIIIWIILDITLLGEPTDHLAHLTMAPRMLITAALILPLGFFMGMPFTKGAGKVGDLIDWGFAVNGAASVLGGTAIVLIAMSFGFTTALVCGGASYVVAGMLLSGSDLWVLHNEAKEANQATEGTSDLFKEA